jgi:hypothetical protein
MNMNDFAHYYIVSQYPTSISEHDGKMKEQMTSK